MKAVAKFRTIVLYKSYFSDFYKIQTKKVKDKVVWVLRLLESIDRLPEEYFKHLSGTKRLYEIRIQQGKNKFRIFCCLESDNRIIVFNGFQKKSQKTPESEKLKAKKILQEYEEENQ
jgi:phage-related protein